MGKIALKVGYAICNETFEGSGVWTDDIIERECPGETTQVVSKWSVNSNSINDNTDISTNISFLADPFAMQNFAHIKYVGYLGCLWKVNSIEVQYPRLILSVGGIYNGEVPSSDILGGE